MIVAFSIFLEEKIMQKGKYCLLRMVNANANNNKEYEMIQLSDSKFEARWGRVEGSKATRIYSMDKWYSIYDSKIKKGYQDVTEFVSVKTTITSQYAPIEDEAVAQLIEEILRYANEFVKSTYKIDKNSVTQAMIFEAQRLIDELNYYANCNNLQGFNYILSQLFVVIPRKMKDVYEHLAKTDSDFTEIMQREQDTLDTLKSVVATNSCDSSSSDGKKTILDAFGIKIRLCTDEERENCKKKLSSESEHLLDKAFRIEIDALEKKNARYMKENGLTRKNFHFFYHGTRNENVWSILKTGLVLNPKEIFTGKLFGYGLYFAQRAKKSIGYTSLRGTRWANGTSDRGYLFVMKVAYKNPYDVYSWGNNLSTFREKDIKALGCDALFAHKGQMLVNDEVIVYNGGAVVPRYLLTLKQ